MADEQIVKPSPIEIQQEYCELLSDRKWDSFSPDDYPQLKLKIGYSLFGPPPETNEEETGGVYTPKQQTKIETVYAKVLENGQFDALPGTIHMACIFTVCQDLKKSEKISQQAVFRIRKCHRREDFNERFLHEHSKRVYGFSWNKSADQVDNYCKIFIDDDGRVYNAWEHYLKKNNLPKCKMFSPRNGIYQYDETGAVVLDVVESPACEIGHRIVNAADTAGTVANVACGTVVVATLIPAVVVAPVVLAGVGVVALGSGIYATARGVVSLVDRKSHKQTLSLADSQARGHWLNAAGGVTTCLSGGTSKILEHCVENGVAIGNVGKVAFNAVVGSNIVVNGVGVANSVHCVITKKLSGDPITALDLFQLTSSVMFFGNAIWSAKTAETFILETQNRILANGESFFTNLNARKLFAQVLKEAGQSNNSEMRRAEIIQGLRNIPNPDLFFRILLHNNQTFNSPSRLLIGQNGDVEVDSSVFINEAEFSNLSEKCTSLSPASKSTDFSFGDRIASFHTNGMFQTILLKITRNPSLQNTIMQLVDCFCSFTRCFILDVTSFILKHSQDQTDIIQIVYRNSHRIFLILQFVIKYIDKQFMHSTQPYGDGFNTNDLINASIQALCTSKDIDQFLLQILHKFREWIEMRLRNFVTTQFESIDRMANSVEYSCPTCNGIYYS